MTANKLAIAMTSLLIAGSFAAAVPDRPPPRAEKPRPPEPLDGRYVMRLPSGFQYTVTVHEVARNIFAIDNAVRFSGLYEKHGNRLVLTHPRGKGEYGFIWEISPTGQITLVDQPPVQKLGQNYLGATLKRAVGKR